MSSLKGEQEDFQATRGRIRATVRDLVLEHGCEDLTLDAISEQAGIAEEQMRQHFESTSSCLLDAYLAFTAGFDRRIFEAFEGVEGWRPALRAAAHAAARQMEEQPRETRFGVRLSLEGGSLIQAHHARHLQRLATLVDRGRQELEDPDSLGHSVAEAVVGAVNALVVSGLQRSDGKRPVDYVPDLMYVAVRPYLGHEVAKEELAISPPIQHCANLRQPGFLSR